MKGASGNVMGNNRKLQVKISIKMEIVYELWPISTTDVMKFLKKSMRQTYTP